MTNDSPTIVSPELHEKFCHLARAQGHDPDSLWVGGYVDYEWTHGRYFLDHYQDKIRDQQVLEFGCNHGATSIILATLGAHVTAIDVDADALELAKANAARYGVSDRIRFQHCTDTRALPFKGLQFDAVTCNSVLEYVNHQELPAVEAELDRVLKADGLLLIYSTSSRLWPIEVHSHGWFSNYLPRWFDRFLPAGKSLQRGVFPGELMAGFRTGYTNLDRLDKGRNYLDIKSRMGLSGLKMSILKIANTLSMCFGVPIGMLTSSLTITLQKNNATTKPN